FQPESSVALGSGFRCGFLGLLHMDVVQERLEREYGLDLLATSPSVAYRIVLNDGVVKEIDNPSMLPEPQHRIEIREPWVDLTVLVPDSFIGTVMELVTGCRGEFKKIEFIQVGRVQESNSSLIEDSSNDADSSTDGRRRQATYSDTRAMLEYSMPLSEILVDFYDQLKSRTQGYASMDYSLVGYRASDLVRLDLLVNGEPVDALSAVLHRNRANTQGKEMVSRLRELIPRQLFEVPIQAAVGGRILARENIKALRKNVLAKCYGGDVTRKRKLLQQQAEGKKRMKRVGRVEIPQEAFLSILKLER
ncbi:MAG: elongation factor 4, partial [Dehalococcoidia bacterium]|nr:elongation factor 4 [Dehalococcoidia bacterium]